MIGYREKDGWHIIFENNKEIEDLIWLVSRGRKAIENWHLSHFERLMGLTLSGKKACVEAAWIFNDKLGIIFNANHHRKGGVTKDIPVIARIDHHLTECELYSYAKTL